MTAESQGALALGMQWNSARPRVLVVACSDGRLQEATDEFLGRLLHITHYDRLYIPGGAGGLSSSGREPSRALQLRNECRYLVDAHDVEQLIALFHGPAADGPEEALCADYRRKFRLATVAQVRAQQEQDARDLITYRHEWAGHAELHMYRCEVEADGNLTFVALAQVNAL